jgi:hypothetical protein
LRAAAGTLYISTICPPKRVLSSVLGEWSAASSALNNIELVLDLISPKLSIEEIYSSDSSCGGLSRNFGTKMLLSSSDIFSSENSARFGLLFWPFGVSFCILIAGSFFKAVACGEDLFLEF